MARNIEGGEVAAEGMSVEIVRIFQAPPALVFRIWTSPEHVVRWYGPEGCGLTHCEMDVRPGGQWRFCMSNGPGHEHWIGGHYREVTEPTRLVFTYVNDRDGHEMLVTIDFAASPDGTEMRFRQERFLSMAERDGHDWGWNSTIGLFSDYLRHLGKNADPVGKLRRDGVLEDFLAAQRRKSMIAHDDKEDRQHDHRT